MELRRLTMAQKIKKIRVSRQTQTAAGVAIWNGLGDICCEGYVRLDQCPEIVTAVSKIAQLIAMTTIHLMANTERGDVRIINELSRKIDIEPCPYMTRKAWMEAIVLNLLLYGKGNSVVLPHTSSGYLGSLEVIPAYQVQFIPDLINRGYTVSINGQTYTPDEVLHFVHNPNKYYPWKGEGLTVYLKAPHMCLHPKRALQASRSCFLIKVLSTLRK